MNRRNFIKGIGSLAAADAAFTLLPQNVFAQELLAMRAARSGLNILQGLTTETTTQLTVDLPKTAKVEFTLVDRQTGKVFQPTWVKSATNAKSSVRVDKIFFTQLELGHGYQLNVKDKSTNKNIDERYLTTVDLTRADARILVMSCMKDGSSARTKMWASAMASNPDYIFMIGDTCYGDNIFSNGPDKLWSRFIETRSNLGYYQWKNLKPVLATWDDHDFGKNDSDGSYKHKVATLSIFNSFFGQENVDSVLTHGPGNSFYFKAFHQNFLFLDSRYYRKISGGFLGSEQIKFASTVMQNARGPTWILEGSPFFGRVEKSKTSYQATSPKELDVFLKEVAKWNSQAIFFGGDVHYAEISSLDKKLLGYQSYEFISSGMHSSTKSGYYDNPNKHLQGVLNEENFMMFEKTGNPLDPNWKVSSIGQNSKVWFNGLYSVA